MVFVFATGTMMNANVNLESNLNLIPGDPYDCFISADAATAGLNHGLTYEEEHELFEELYDDCMG